MRHVRPRVFVTRLSSDCDESALHEFFSRFCEVTGAWIVRDKATGISKNFGFVELQTDDDYGVALSLNNYEFNGRQIVVAAARKQ